MLVVESLVELHSVLYNILYSKYNDRDDDRRQRSYLRRFAVAFKNKFVRHFYCKKYKLYINNDIIIQKKNDLQQ